MYPKMKLRLHQICLVALFLSESALSAPGFQGLEFSTGMVSNRYTAQGSEIYSSSGTDTGSSSGQAQQNNSGATIGLGYTVPYKGFMTTFAVDYSKISTNITSPILTPSTVTGSVQGPVTQSLQNRVEASFEPGYVLTKSTLTYLKLGVVNTPTHTPIDTGSTTSALSGGFSSLGVDYGVGIKQKLFGSSSTFLKYEFSKGMSKNAQTTDAVLNTYQSKLMFNSATISLGYYLK
jgi:hypothetical protein